MALAPLLSGGFDTLVIDVWIKWFEVEGNHPILNEDHWDRGDLHYQVCARLTNFLNKYASSACIPQHTIERVACRQLVTASVPTSGSRPVQAVCVLPSSAQELPPADLREPVWLRRERGGRPDLHLAARTAAVVLPFRHVLHLAPEVRLSPSLPAALSAVLGGELPQRDTSVTGA
eukprot:SAG11_NODE_1607_length_4590_cov_2.099978_2_plen_175_part_00